MDDGGPICEGRQHRDAGRRLVNRLPDGSLVRRSLREMPMIIRYETVDVFTQQAFGGNPLAVVSDARGLSDSQMQHIANEFNYSETTFVLPPEDPAHTANVRIFTPQTEIPFAGHPNVGTAFVVARHGEAFGKPVGTAVAFEEAAGLVKLDLLREESATVGARLQAPQPLSVGDAFDPDIVAKACGLSLVDLDVSTRPPQNASAGMSFIIARVKSRAALAQATPRLDVFMDHIPMEQSVGIHLYTYDSDRADIETRMFAPLFGVPEDPATGSANVALIGYLAHLDPAPEMVLEQRISQGVDMGRPSLMTAAAHKEKGSVTQTFIGGACVPVMNGEINL